MSGDFFLCLVLASYSGSPGYTSVNKIISIIREDKLLFVHPKGGVSNLLQFGGTAYQYTRRNISEHRELRNKISFQIK
jgi:hypothetical protein